MLPGVTLRHARWVLKQSGNNVETAVAAMLEWGDAPPEPPPEPAPAETPAPVVAPVVTPVVVASMPVVAQTVKVAVQAVTRLNPPCFPSANCK